MIKAAVIGVGSMGRNHARVYRELPTVDLVAVSDADEATSAKVGANINVPHETDYERLLDTYKPDVVSLCVPTNLHFEVAKKIIDRGVHLLIEKPITESVEQAEQLIALAKEKGVKLTVGHIERFNPAIVGLKERLDSGMLSRVFRVQARRQGPFPARIRDVGVVIDLATHDLDMMRYVLGTEITRVYAEIAQGINTDREDIMDCVVRSANGVIGTLNINWMTPTKIREVTVMGAEGMFLVNTLMQELYFYENDVTTTDGEWQSLNILTGVSEGNITRFKLSRYEPLRAELENFTNAVRDDKEPLVSGEDGKQALKLAQALIQSGEESRIITFD